MEGGLPPSIAGETYAQLLTMIDPPPNVLVASADEPFATMGKNEETESQLLAENQRSAIPFAALPPLREGRNEELDS